MINRQQICGSGCAFQKFIADINLLMNFADVTDACRSFKNPQYVTAVDDSIAFVRVDVQKINRNAARLRLLRELDNCAEIFGGVVDKIFVGVEEDNPIARSIFNCDVARRREIILPSLVKNSRAEFLSDFNG